MAGMTRYQEKDWRRTRLDFLRTLSAAGLAKYLEQELGDSVPVDWYDWLTEEVEG